jgi:hypothetical protein
LDIVSWAGVNEGKKSEGGKNTKRKKSLGKEIISSRQTLVGLVVKYRRIQRGAEEPLIQYQKKVERSVLDVGSRATDVQQRDVDDGRVVIARIFPGIHKTTK